MKFDLMVDDKNNITFETCMGLTMISKESGIDSVWEQIRDLKCKGCEVTFYRFTGTNRYTICNNKLALFWDCENVFKTLKIYLDLMTLKDKEYDSIIINNSYGFKPYEVEVLNIYNLVTYLLLTGYNKGDTIHLGDIRVQLSGLYMTISMNNVMVLTRNHTECDIANGDV